MEGDAPPWLALPLVYGRYGRRQALLLAEVEGVAVAGGLGGTHLAVRTHTQHLAGLAHALVDVHLAADGGVHGVQLVGHVLPVLGHLAQEGLDRAAQGVEVALVGLGAEGGYGLAQLGHCFGEVGVGGADALRQLVEAFGHGFVLHGLDAAFVKSSVDLPGFAVAEADALEALEGSVEVGTVEEGVHQVAEVLLGGLHARAEAVVEVFEGLLHVSVV